MRTKIDFTDSVPCLKSDAAELGVRVKRILKPGLYHTRGCEYPIATLEGTRKNLTSFLSKYGYDLDAHPITL